MMNSISMTRLAATISSVMGAEAPKQADRPIPHVEKMVERVLGKKADRVMIYNPDALAMYLYQKYTEEFLPVTERVQLEVPMATVMPAVTPVCFGTMYTGALPKVHGIQEYAKPVIQIDSLFDALARSGKKVALVAVEDSSMALIFAGREIDYFLEKDDAAVVEKALELIEKDEYDLISVYNQEYDDYIHDETPESENALMAMKHHIDAFAQLADAVKEHWTNHDSVVCMATDHGTHINWEGFGDHGEFIEDDINVIHFYGAYPKK
ncbi:MAG: hypothetical protein Q4B70_02425 [Lachnospiraceae bacterium]|nr:hypothetical protein [Lachnospiraceae bacterium]